jgi:hypothetical protein
MRARGVSLCGPTNLTRGARVVAGVVLFLILAVVVAVALLVMNTDALVKDAIETVAGQQLGVPVHVRRAHIAFRQGAGRIEGLTIANPGGFEGDDAMSIEAINIAFDVTASTTKVVVIKRIDVTGADVRTVATAAGSTNFGVLLDNLKRNAGNRGTGTTNLKLIIDRFDFTSATASARLPLLDHPQPIEMPDVHVTDIGRRSGGVPVAEAARALLSPIVKAVVKSARDAGRGKVEDSLEHKLGGSLSDTLRELGHPTD